MPKRLHEIKNFDKGTYITPSDTDIPENSADYSLNIDPLSKDGVLKGIHKDEIKYFRDSEFTASSPASGAQSNGSNVIAVDSVSSFNDSGTLIFVDTEGHTQVLSHTGRNTVTNRFSGVSGWDTSFGDLGNDTKVYGKNTSLVNFSPNSSALINNNGTRHLVFTDSTDNKIKKIDQVYGENNEPPNIADISTGAESVTGTPTMVKNNREVHIGMGNEVNDKPLWCGFQNQGQFGTQASTDLILADAELHSTTTFPSFHKTVESGNFVYGISFDGKYLYYIKKSVTPYVVNVSNLIFTKTKAMALDHNGYLMIIDDNNTIVWVDVSSTDHSVVKTYGIEKAGSYTGEMTDIIETGGSYVWIAQSASATTHTSTGTPPQTATGLGLLQSAAYPSGTSGTLSFTDRTPWQGHKTTLGGLSAHIIGGWYHSNNTNGTTAPGTSHSDSQMSIWTYPHSLVKGSDSNWVGWICEFTRSGAESSRIALNVATNGTTGNVIANQLVDMNGPVLNYVKNDYAPVYDPSTLGNNDPDPESWFPVRLKNEDDATLDIRGRYGASGDLSNAVAQATWHGITSIYSHDSGHSTNDRIFITLNTENSSGVSDTDTKILCLSYNDPTPTGGAFVKNHWLATDNTGTWDQNSTPTVYFYAQENSGLAGSNGSLATHVYTTDASKIRDMRLTSNDTGFTYAFFLNSGSGNGKIASLKSASSGTFASWTKKLQAPIDITLSQTNMETNSSYSASKEYWYKTSFTYDGYQESPLGIATQLNTPTTKNVEITMDVYTDTLSSRVTHVNLYRAESASDGVTEPTGFYRLVDSYKLDVSWKISTDTTWGTTRQKVVVDNYKLGASYEARTGISEVIDHTIPNYTLSTELNSHLYVAKCHHQLVENADNYIFKSRPYNYDQFNWINDFLILPTTPTALKSFRGRLYAFDENNMYRIEPNNLYIEDVIEGVGCTSQQSIIVTDYGMCFCDKDNIYLHDGNSAVPISTVINGTLGNTSDLSDKYSWSNAVKSFNPIVTFSSKHKSFVIMFQFDTTNSYKAWAYNVIRRRWDLWDILDTENVTVNTSPRHAFIGKNGEINVSANNQWFALYEDPTLKRSWDWHSKRISLGQVTQIKRFNNFTISGTLNGDFANNVSVKIDGASTTEAGTLNNFTISTPSGKVAQVFLTSQTNEVDGIGVVYRRKIVTSEQ